MSKEPDRSQRKALGKGLSALLPSRNKQSEEATEVANHSEFIEIPLDQINANEDQPRNSFDQQKIEELAQSIKSHGVIQPITVRRTGHNRFHIIAGERRWRAAQLAGLTHIPAVVRSAVEHDVLELALIENIQREDLNPIEVAAAFYRLSTDYHLSHEQIAERTGKDRSTVTNFLRLLRLSEAVKAELAAGNISMGHARALLNVADPERQTALCRDIRARQLSVRATEDLVRSLTEKKDRAEGSHSKGATGSIDPNIRAALEEMSAALGTRIKLVQRSGAAGRLEIEYYSEEDLERIYSAIVRS